MLNDPFRLKKNFYGRFKCNFRRFEIAEPRLSVTAGKTLELPLVLRKGTNEAQEIVLKFKSKLPVGWSEEPYPSRFTIDAKDVYPLQILIKTPAAPSENWNEISYALESKGRETRAAVLKVQLRKNAIPQ